eukprot:735394-Heterocapsa_arctica.AAC.1
MPGVGPEVLGQPGREVPEAHCPDRLQGLHHRPRDQGLQGGVGAEDGSTAEGVRSRQGGWPPTLAV